MKPTHVLVVSLYLLFTLTNIDLIVHINIDLSVCLSVRPCLSVSSYHVVMKLYYYESDRQELGSRLG